MVFDGPAVAWVVVVVVVVRVVVEVFTIFSFGADLLLVCIHLITKVGIFRAEKFDVVWYAQRWSSRATRLVEERVRKSIDFKPS